jgi:hypothetical protein
VASKTAPTSTVPSVVAHPLNKLSRHQASKPWVRTGAGRGAMD